MKIVIDTESINWHIKMEELRAVYSDYHTFKFFTDCLCDICKRINDRATFDAIERLVVDNAETKADNNRN